MSDWIVRELDSRDQAALGALFERNNVPDVTRFFLPFELTRATAENLLKPGRKDRFFGVAAGDRIIAFSMLRGYDEGYEVPSFGILVDRPRQGRGVGRRLTEWTLRWADRQSVPKIRLTVFEINTPARRLYESLGFAVTARAQHENGEWRLTMHRLRVAPGQGLFEG